MNILPSQNRIIGIAVSPEVWTIRGGRKVVVARYRDGRKIWDEKPILEIIDGWL